VLPFKTVLARAIGRLDRRNDGREAGFGGEAKDQHIASQRAAGEQAGRISAWF
jgi:hypothetical protein